MYKVKTDNFNIPMLYFNMLYLLNIDIYFSQPILTQNLRAKSLEHSESAISGSGLFKISGDVFLFTRLCWKTRRNTDASISWRWWQCSCHTEASVLVPSLSANFKVFSEEQLHFPCSFPLTCVRIPDLFFPSTPTRMIVLQDQCGSGWVCGLAKDDQSRRIG